MDATQTNHVRQIAGADEDEHANDRQDGEENLLMFAEAVEGIKGHYQSSTSSDLRAGPAAAGLDTRRNGIVWVKGVLHSRW